MTAVQNSSDRSDCTASSLSYEELVSVLMYYFHMSKNEILHSSRKFLIALYQSYVKRACENLGVSSDSTDEDSGKPGKSVLTDADYPSEFVSFTQAQREKMIADSGESDADFLSKFREYKAHGTGVIKR